MSARNAIRKACARTGRIVDAARRVVGCHNVLAETLRGRFPLERSGVPIVGMMRSSMNLDVVGMSPCDLTPRWDAAIRSFGTAAMSSIACPP